MFLVFGVVVKLNRKETVVGVANYNRNVVSFYCFCFQHFSYRTSSPGLVLRDYNKSGTLAENISRIYTYSYLTEEPTLGYLRKPIDPYDKIPTSPHFHRPTCE